MDPIANMIVHLKNSSMARRASAAFPYSNMKMAISAVLEREKYIGAVTKKGKKVKKFIEVELLYDAEKVPRIRGVRRISKPSRRSYWNMHDLARMRRGSGTVFLSTPKGILTGVDAYKEKVGGEALFRVW